MGWTKFDNDLLESMYKMKLSGSAFRVALCIYRLTIGYNRLKIPYSLLNICSETELPYKTAERTIAELCKCGILQKDGGMIWITFEGLIPQKCPSETGEKSLKNGELVPQKRGKNPSKMGDAIHYSKEKRQFIKKKDDLLSQIKEGDADDGNHGGNSTQEGGVKGHHF